MMRNPLAVTFQFIAVITLVIGVLLVILDSEKWLYAVACIGNALFMYGFAYIVEAASIYIDKDKKERMKNYQY